MRKNNQSLERTPLVLQYNKRDLPNAAPVDYLEYLHNNGPRRHYSFEAAAASGHNVLTTLNAISHEVLSRFAQRDAKDVDPTDLKIESATSAASRGSLPPKQPRQDQVAVGV